MKNLSEQPISRKMRFAQAETYKYPFATITHSFSEDGSLPPRYTTTSVIVAKRVFRSNKQPQPVAVKHAPFTVWV